MLRILMRSKARVFAAVVVGVAGVAFQGLARARPGSLSVGASAGPSKPAPSHGALGGIPVRVVDESGVPLADVELEGSSPVNPGPVASFCCTPVTFAKTKTDAEGRAVLGPVPFTFRPLTVWAKYRDWPPRRWQSPRPGPLVPSSLVLVLGPARDIHGKVRLAPTCPASALKVLADNPRQEVAVNADGTFALSQVAPGTHLVLHGCSRRQDVDLDIFKGRPVELELPGELDRKPANTVRAVPMKPE